MILSSLLVLGGFILFVVPAVIITFRIYLAPYIMIDQNIGPIQALKLSNKLLRGNAVETFGIYGLFYTLCFVMIAVEIFVPVVGAILGGLLMFCGLAAMQIYLTWLYLDFSELSRQNMRRPKTSVVNIWLPILALVTMVGLLSSISYWISSSVKANKIYVTECYQVKLPAIYSVERKGACHLLAVSGSSTLEYRPIKSGAISARQLVSQGLTAIFPSNRYELFNSSASTYTPDGNSYIAVNLRDKQANGAFVTVVFINSQAPRYIDGADINNFVLIQPAIAGARPQTDFINQLVRNSIIITKTVTLNTVGSSAFKSNIENAIEAWNNGRYEDVMTYATNAKLDAATDYERSVVFGWQGEAEAALNKVASAEADLREGLKLNPADVLSWNALGNLLYQNRDDKAALECAAKMLSIDDSYASAYNLRGLISQARGNKAAAATDFNKALKLDPSNESIRKNLDSLR
jgi:tetratricopeptide (TPR) repeat protein